MDVLCNGLHDQGQKVLWPLPCTDLITLHSREGVRNSAEWLEWTASTEDGQPKCINEPHKISNSFLYLILPPLSRYPLSLLSPFPPFLLISPSPSPLDSLKTLTYLTPYHTSHCHTFPTQGYQSRLLPKPETDDVTDLYIRDMKCLLDEVCATLPGI